MSNNKSNLHIRRENALVCVRACARAHTHNAHTYTRHAYTLYTHVNNDGPALTHTHAQ